MVTEQSLSFNSLFASIESKLPLISLRSKATFSMIWLKSIINSQIDTENVIIPCKKQNTES